MLVRLRQLNVLTEKEFLGMRALPVIRTARILGYTTDLYLATEEEAVLSSYAEKAKTARDLGRISEGRYRQLLLRTFSMVRRLRQLRQFKLSSPVVIDADCLSSFLWVRKGLFVLNILRQTICVPEPVVLEISSLLS